MAAITHLTQGLGHLLADPLLLAQAEALQEQAASGTLLSSAQGEHCEVHFVTALGSPRVKALLVAAKRLTVAQALGAVEAEGEAADNLQSFAPEDLFEEEAAALEACAYHFTSHVPPLASFSYLSASE